mgnify:CR=1 FL=1
MREAAPGATAAHSARLKHQRLAHEIGGVLRAQLAHCFGAVAFEGARADAHAQRALLVGATFADQGKHLALAMGWNESFVGTIFVAFVTSVPELVVTIAAVRIGALDMAIGNLLGSNLFDIAILALDDLLYLPGPILSHVSATHGVSALSAMVMAGVAIIGLLYRPRTRVFRTVGWVSIFLLLVYLLNSYILFLHGGRSHPLAHPDIRFGRGALAGRPGARPLV